MLSPNFWASTAEFRTSLIFFSFDPVLFSVEWNARCFLLWCKNIDLPFSGILDSLGPYTSALITRIVLPAPDSDTVTLISFFFLASPFSSAWPCLFPDWSLRDCSFSCVVSFGPLFFPPPSLFARSSYTALSPPPFCLRVVVFTRTITISCDPSAHPHRLRVFLIYPFDVFP